ncbi:MAG: hypothetical protein JWR18_3897 [Segetibacter sp.]|jgi:hypothetical protein|nr:hypothetical protein [Segetibacter sp.]
MRRLTGLLIFYIVVYSNYQNTPLIQFLYSVDLNAAKTTFFFSDKRFSRYILNF